MEVFWVCLILFSIPVIAFVFAGGYLLINHLIKKRIKNKWYKALATNSELRELLDTHNKLWKIYDQKSDIANGYMKQIDHLLGNLTYLPNYECEWRKQKAEEYTRMYFEARTEANRWYEAYCKANDLLNEYCEKHKIKRRD